VSARARWALVAVVLLVAVAVAVWPRDDAPTPPAAAPPAPDLVQARTAAALQPCAVAEPGPADLRGVATSCLGTGEQVDAAAALGGRDLLVNVWATWCIPCREELPLLARYAAEPGAVPVVGVAVQSTPADSLLLLKTLGVTLPTLIDESGALTRALRTPDALPASYLVKADGTVTRVQEPRLFRTLDDIRGAVAKGL
jgi:thiol-disulfide isomerase/thioredoxin